MRRPLLTLTLFFLVASPANAAWTWPVNGEVITPYRNVSDPYASGQHRGIDIAAPVGTPVVAAAGGDVRFAGTAGSSGLTIAIRTGDGYDTSYLHLSTVGVRAGARVSAGQRIGAVGTTGVRSATAPHLHFGVRDAGTRYAYHDPLAFLPPLPTHVPRPPAAAPIPAPAPAPPATAPAPVPRTVPARRAAPRRLRTPRSAPGEAPAPAALHAPVSAPRAMPAPSAVPHGIARPTSLKAPAHEPRRAGSIHRTTPRARAHRHAERLDPALKPTHAGGDARVAIGRRSAGTPAPAHAEPGHGPDIGWAAACAGLLLAAALLGLSDDGRRSGARVRSRLLAALSRG